MAGRREHPPTVTSESFSGKPAARAAGAGPPPGRAGREDDAVGARRRHQPGGAVRFAGRVGGNRRDPPAWRRGARTGPKSAFGPAMISSRGFKLASPAHDSDWKPVTSVAASRCKQASPSISLGR